MRPRVGAAAAVLLALAALTLVVLGSRSDTPRFSAPTAVPEPPVVAITPTPTASGSGSGQQVVPHNAVFEGFSLFMFILVVLVVATAVVLAFPRSIRRPSWRRYRTMRGTGPGERPARTTRALTDAVTEGLREVERGEVADAIIGCWLRLEAAAADAGTARRATDTADDLTVRVLAAHRVSPGTLRGLADLYREARFSSHRLGESERDRARAGLERVRAELGGAGPAVPAAPSAPSAGEPV